MAHFGEAEAPLPDPKKLLEEADPDDELLPETPPDVVMMLGFDPAETDGFDISE